MKKYFIKKNYPFIIFVISSIIIISHIIYGISINTENEKIVAESSTYYFWNIVALNEENVELWENWDTILPRKKDNNIEYKSIIVEKIKKLLTTKTNYFSNQYN